MPKLRIRKTEHGVAMSSTDFSRIPEGIETARAMNLRGLHYGWPGITRTKDGDILVGASERLRHVDPFGREVIARSSDGGRTWSEPQVIFDSVSDDRDQALCTLPDGTIISTWFGSMAWTENMRPEWEPILRRTTPDTLRALARGWLRRSHDGGRTWEQEVYPTIVGQHAGPSVLSNGDLIYCGPYREPDASTRMLATRSADGGRTWSIVGEIPVRRIPHPRTGRPISVLNENHALEVSPGRILVAFRGSQGNYNIHAAISSDGGSTWSEPQDLGVYGYPSYLVRLKAGPILCLFGDRRPPQAIRAMLSYDDGLTWDVANLLTVRQFDYRSDMGYPVALEVDPGEILCVYYSVPGPDMPDYASFDMRQSGILCTRFWLE